MPIHYNSKVKTVVEQTRNAQYSSWTICSLVFYMLFLQTKQQNTSKLTKSEEKASTSEHEADLDICVINQGNLDKLILSKEDGS